MAMDVKIRDRLFALVGLASQTESGSPSQLQSLFDMAPQHSWKKWHFFIGPRSEVCSDTGIESWTIGFVTEELEPSDIALDPYNRWTSAPTDERSTVVSLFLRLHYNSYMVINHGSITSGIVSGHDLVNEVDQFDLAFS